MLLCGLSCCLLQLSQPVVAGTVLPGFLPQDRWGCRARSNLTSAHNPECLLAWCVVFVQVDIDCLDGQVIHLPCEPPEARHIRPPKDLLSGRYDLLAYVKAAVKPTPLGHLELGPQEPDNPGQLRHGTECCAL